MNEKRFPKVGDRVGFVTGPGQFPEENQGTVIKVYGSDFYDNCADIERADGSMEPMVGPYTTKGIGCHFIESAPVLEAA